MRRKKIAPHRVEPHQVGQAVILAVRAGQELGSLSLVKRLERLQMPDQLTQGAGIEHSPPPL